MNDKRNTCRIDEYIDPNFNLTRTHPQSNHQSLLQLRGDKLLLPRASNGSYMQSKENVPVSNSGKVSPFLKQSVDNSEHKLLHQYMQSREAEIRNNLKRQKIAHIFNIRSIDLVDKPKNQKEKDKSEGEKPKQKITRISHSDIRRLLHEKRDKQTIRAIHFMTEKKRQPAITEKRRPQKRYHSSQLQKICETKQVSIGRNTEPAQGKIGEYLEYLRTLCEGHGMQLPEVENYAKNAIVVTIGRGNNAGLIRQLFKKRWWLTINEDKSRKIGNMTWTQLKEKLFYEASYQLHRVSSGKESLLKFSNASIVEDLGTLRIHNHFEFNEFLGNKKALFYCMRRYYEAQGKNVFDYLPVTFHIKSFDDLSWQQFMGYHAEDISKYPQQQRLWIVKPGENTNRGNGITVHQEIGSIRELIEGEWKAGSSKTFIIQKYIDKPLLYNRRKFDIRCYMLLSRLNGKIKGYWYQQGYIRTSCYDYHPSDINNQFVHLTNDAIQQKCERYGKYEDGNKLNYHNFQRYLDQKGYCVNFQQNLLPQLKQIATDAIQASWQMLGQWTGVPTFEVFGLDFMIDANFKPWLIEVNTNPCLQTSSTTLERIIPRMVDSAFKLTVDLLFPPPTNWPNSRKHYMPNRASHNLFEPFFQQPASSLPTPVSQQQIEAMGQIEQDNEVYDQKEQGQKKFPEPVSFT